MNQQKFIIQTVVAMILFLIAGLVVGEYDSSLGSATGYGLFLLYLIIRWRSVVKFVSS